MELNIRMAWLSWVEKTTELFYCRSVPIPKQEVSALQIFLNNIIRMNEICEDWAPELCNCFKYFWFFFAVLVKKLDKGDKVVGEKTQIMYASVSRTFLIPSPRWEVLHTDNIIKKHSCGKKLNKNLRNSQVNHACSCMWYVRLCSYISPQTWS